MMRYISIKRRIIVWYCKQFVFPYNSKSYRDIMRIIRRTDCNFIDYAYAVCELGYAIGNACKAFKLLRMAFTKVVEELDE